MSRKKEIKIVLNPNSEYHRILVKNLGEKGAVNALTRCTLAYSLDFLSYKKINAWRPKR